MSRDFDNLFGDISQFGFLIIFTGIFGF